jgi:hypothetical protein
MWQRKANEFFELTGHPGQSSHPRARVCLACPAATLSASRRRGEITENAVAGDFYWRYCPF